MSAAIEPNPYALEILAALGSRQMYEGTAPRHAVKRRRAKNKVARRSRRINRGQ